MRRITTLCVCFMLTGLVFAGDKENKPQMRELDISVWDKTGLKSLRPVTGGVPLSQGVAPEGTRFILHDENNKIVPSQASVLARWKDGSARWILLDFQSAPSVKEKAHYKLSWGKEVKNNPPKVPVRVQTRKNPIH